MLNYFIKLYTFNLIQKNLEKYTNTVFLEYIVVIIFINIFYKMVYLSYNYNN